MSPIKQIKDNPLLALVVALLLAAIGTIGAMNQFSLATLQTTQRESDRKLWEKLDRVTTLMTREADKMDAKISDMQKIVICHDKDITKIIERMDNHLTEYERRERNGGRK